MEKYNFNVQEHTDKIVKWIQEWFNINGKGCNAVIGISGGKDSSVVAALCVKALGKDRVIGVRMPCGSQPDIDVAIELCNALDIKSYEINIYGAVTGVLNYIENANDYSALNLPPRIRMATLYAVSQSNNGRVIGTCNLSEEILFYSTLWGDSACDMNPIKDYTVTEVISIGEYLGLDKKFTHKIPDDGLPNSRPDEEKFGFTYKALDEYIRERKNPGEDVLTKIFAMINKSKFKEGVINVPYPKSELSNVFNID